MRTEFIPDEDIEAYFKAADVCVLPYKTIFQSGVLFLAYRFGLPVVATDVGSMSRDVINGRTGFICRPEDPGDLANKLTEFFGSRLCRERDRTREDIRQRAEDGHSWSTVASTTYEAYRACSAGRGGRLTRPRISQDIGVK
jgi:glycosyltransferase involved in cell wall biosynthesis